MTLSGNVQVRRRLCGHQQANTMYRMRSLGLIPRRVARWLAAAVLVFGVSSGLQAQTSAPVDSAGSSAFALQPGDVVRLRIWREPDLSGDFTVDPTGVVTLPRLGMMTVTGVAPDTLKTRIVGGFQPFLTHSSIEVILQRRIRVSGAVRTPGLYPADATLTIADVIALAGGATPQGKLDKVRLVREGRKLQVTLDAGTPIGSLPLRSGDELFVPERSWLSRNPGIVIGGIGTIISVVYAVSRFSH
jgi:protein involved in polysaccharide export with SLBB domain